MLSHYLTKCIILNKGDEKEKNEIVFAQFTAWLSINTTTKVHNNWLRGNVRYNLRSFDVKLHQITQKYTNIKAQPMWDLLGQNQQQYLTVWQTNLVITD